MDTEQAGRPKETGAAARRSWEPPRITFEEDFEPYAYSTCGKLPAQGSQCAAHWNS